MSETKVCCRICNKEFKQITYRHLKHHDLTLDAYVALYPNAQLRSDESLRIKKESATRANFHRRGVPRSEEVKKKISETNKGNTAPNKGIPMKEEQKLLLSKVKKEKFAKGEIVHWNSGNKTSDETKDKIRQTLLDGNHHMSEESKEKRAKTFKEKRKSGRIYPSTHEFLKKLHSSHNPLAEKLFNDKHWLYKQHIEKQRTIASICVELGLDWKKQATTVGRQLTKFDIPIHRWTNKISAGQLELELFLSSIDINFESNDRSIISPLELDIVIPEHKLAIEYNGLFWHSELSGKDSNYHLEKTIECEKQGYRLIHIMEDEWRDQQQKCKDTLKHLLGKSERGVYARNTIIREISWNEAREFLSVYHLLGSGTPGNYRIGAFHNDELIGVMVFGQKGTERSNDIELKRFVTNKKNNPGLGSKMFKYATRNNNYTSIMAFVDRRWFTGGVKDHIGFEREGYSPPSIWWTDGINRYHRRFTTKQKLIKEGFRTQGETKQEILYNLGYCRIWDAGKIKLRWFKNKS